MQLENHIIDHNYSEEKASDCYVAGFIFAAQSSAKFSEIVSANPYKDKYNGYRIEWENGAKEGVIERGNYFSLDKNIRAFVLFHYGIDLKNTPTKERN